MIDALEVIDQTPDASAGGWRIADAEGVHVLTIPDTVARTRHEAERTLRWVAPVIAKVSRHAERSGWRKGREALSSDLRRLLGAAPEASL